MCLVYFINVSFVHPQPCMILFDFWWFYNMIYLGLPFAIRGSAHKGSKLPYPHTLRGGMAGLACLLDASCIVVLQHGNQSVPSRNPFVEKVPEILIPASPLSSDGDFGSSSVSQKGASVWLPALPRRSQKQEHTGFLEDIPFVF